MNEKWIQDQLKRAPKLTARRRRRIVFLLKGAVR